MIIKHDITKAHVGVPITKSKRPPTSRKGLDKSKATKVSSTDAIAWLATHTPQKTMKILMIMMMSLVICFALWSETITYIKNLNQSIFLNSNKEYYVFKNYKQHLDFLSNLYIRLLLLLI